MIGRALYDQYVILFNPREWVSANTSGTRDTTFYAPLFELTQTQLNQLDLYKRILLGAILLPLLCTAVMLLVIGDSYSELQGPLTGALLAWLAGLTMLVALSIPVGLAVSFWCPPLSIVFWRGNDADLFDIITEPALTLTIGLCTLVSLIISNNFRPYLFSDSVGGSIEARILGFLSSVIILAVVVLGFEFLFRQGPTVQQSVSLTWGFVFMGILFLATLSLCLRFRRASKVAIIFLVFLLPFVFHFATNSEEFRVTAGLVHSGTLVFPLLSASYLALLVTLYGIASVFSPRHWALSVALILSLVSVFFLQQAYGLYDYVSASIVLFVCVVFGLLFPWIWSVVVFLPEALWNRMLLAIEQRQGIQTLHLNTAFHEELQRFPVSTLPAHLLAAEHATGYVPLQKIRYLEGSRQGWSIDKYSFEKEATLLRQFTSLDSIAEYFQSTEAAMLSGRSPEIRTRLQKSASKLSTALLQMGSFNQLQELRSTLLDVKEIEADQNRHRYGVASVPYASVPSHWVRLLESHVERLRSESETNREVPNPYIVGVPLTRYQRVFVGRRKTARFIEDLLSDRDYAPVLLYGSRRIGKTSLLYQLRWLLPPRVLVIVIDLQGPTSLSRNIDGFFEVLAKTIVRSAKQYNLVLTPLPIDLIVENPFGTFDDWLEESMAKAAKSGFETIFLAFDEFEALERSFSNGNLNADEILGFFRHLMQHKPQMKILFAGSNSISDYGNWSTYLLNVHSIQLGMLEYHEAQELITAPTEHFPLKYDQCALDLCLAFSSRHPYITQLLCMEIVALKNTQSIEHRFNVSEFDVQQAFQQAMERGQLFFLDIEKNLLNETQRKAATTLATNLRAGTYTAAAGTLSRIEADSLSRKGIIDITENGDLQFKIGAVAHWFQMRGQATVTY